MFLRHFFLENDAGRRLYFLFFLIKCYKMMCQSNFPKNFRLGMRTSQSTNKMAANDGRPKLTIRDV